MQAKQSVRSQIDTYLPDIERFYEWLIRQKYVLPPIKSNIITVKFLDRVARQEVFMPKIDNCRLVKIAKPPSRKAVQTELVRVMEQLNPEEAAGWALIKELKTKNADMQWLQTILYMVCPDHYFFDPAYSRLNKAQNKKDPLMDEDDKFSIYKDAF